MQLKAEAKEHIEVRTGMLGIYAVKVNSDTDKAVDFCSRRFMSYIKAEAYANRWAIRERLEYRR